MSLHLVADLQANKDRFVRAVRETREVWGLRSGSGWANCPSHKNDGDVLLFWSEAAYAKRLAVAEWSDYVPTSIDLASFVENWLPGMHKDQILVGVNFNADLAGLEIEPLELANDLLPQS